MANKNDQKHIWWRRWLDRGALALVASALGALLLPWFLKHLNAVWSGYRGLPFWLPSLAFLVLSAALLYRACHGRWCACLGLKHFVTDPPLWVAVIPAGALLSVVHGPWPWCIPIAVCVVGLVVVVSAGAELVARCGAEPPRSETEDEELGDSPGTKVSAIPEKPDFDAIRKWAKDDRPVEVPADDRFGYDAIAERIARRLTEGKSVAVVGALGSGKTTTGRLVEQHLKQDHTLFLQISLWPYESAQTAANGILSALIETLGRETQTIELRGLPASYLDATAAAGGWVATLARLGRTESEPKQIVDRLDQLCERIDRKLVLWVDDAERFSGRRSADGALPADFDERYGPIRALLHLLDDAEWIIVVMADTGLETRVDHEKIVRFVEWLPEVDDKIIRQLLGVVREACLRGPLKPEFIPKESGKFPRRLEADFARVVATPRSLKQCLRLVIETWEQIPGEISFDSMLALSALRVAQPELFTILLRHVELLRSENLSSMAAGAADLRSPENPPGKTFERPNRQTEFDDLGRALEDVLKNLPDAGLWAACAGLLDALLTVKADERKGVIDVDEHDHQRNILQGVFSSGYVNYLRRYLNQAVETEHSDQSILKAIHDAIPELETRGDRLTKLLELLLDEKVARHVGEFFAEFEMEQIETLLERVVDAEIDGGQRLLGTHVIVEMLRSKWAEDHYGMDSGNRTPWEDLFGQVFDRLFDSDLINACRFVKQVSPVGPPGLMAGEAFREHVKARMRLLNPDEGECLRKWADEPSEPEPGSPANVVE